MNALRVVNTVWQGKMGFPLELEIIMIILRNHLMVNSISLQNASTIKQLKIELKPGGTVLFFKSGSFRIMGSMDDFSAHDCMYTLLNELCIEIPEINVQTMTAVSSNRLNVNLDRLSKHLNKRIYEPELFPAIQITQYKPIHVNIFSTGCVVILGLKNIEGGIQILDKLTPHILHSQYAD